MATRYPIIYNPGANQLQEIPSGDDLDFSNNNLYNVNIVGVATVGSVSIGSTQVITSTRDLQNIVSISASGPALIGSATSTGTVGQALQVTGGTYISNNLGVGTTNPTSTLHVVGNALITGIITSTDYNSASDINLKADIETINNALGTLGELRGVSFTWKENNRPSYGVIAQEVENILPELVSNTDPKTVNYNGLIGVLIEAVKELSLEVNEIKKQLNN